MSKPFLLEIGLEELPARFVEPSVHQLADKIEEWLKERRIPYDKVQSFGTPRRLAVYVEGLAAKQEDQTEEAKGPAKKIAVDEDGEWSKAALGFAKSKGITTDDLFLKEFKGQEYVFAKKHNQGQPTENLLPEMKQVITSLSFPKNMRWGAYDFAYARPIRWLVALYGVHVVPMEITGIHSGKETYGHRFFGQKIALQTASEYEQKLEEQYVLADIGQRKAHIQRQLEQLEQAQGWQIPVDADLLDEVTHLVEYPTAVFGSFDQEFLSLPDDVLITTMKEHQRYFPVRNQQGALLPHFVTIRNGVEDEEGIISRGNEKVLRARLADARFFYEEDQKVKIDTAASQLEHVVFHEELGTMGDKVRRVREIATVLSQELDLSVKQKDQLQRAAEICKFDLTTQMVDEFPELQGKMGQIYAQLAGEDEQVSQAIYEHYLPRFAKDELPQSEMGTVLSIADKMDSIISCFSIGLVPTGSQDPYALRRQAAGIVNMIVEGQYNLDMEQLVDVSLQILQQRQVMKRTADEIHTDFQHFFKLRVKNKLQEQGIRYDVIDSVLPQKVEHVLSIFAKAYLLHAQVDQPMFKQVVEAFTRVSNIAEKIDTPKDVVTDLFTEEEEQALFAAYTTAQETFDTAVKNGHWQEAYESLVQLQQPIDRYFEQVMVMVEEETVRTNRLSLLVEISSLIARFADFSKIVFASKE